MKTPVLEDEDEDDDEYEDDWLPASSASCSGNSQAHIRGCAVKFLVTGKEFGIDRVILFVRLDNRGTMDHGAAGFRDRLEMTGAISRQDP